MNQPNSAVVLLCGGAINTETEWRSGARIDLAVRLASERESYLLVSSGVSGHQENADACPESHLYIQELVRRFPAFPKDRLLVEDFSRDTVGNVYFSLQVLRSVLASVATVVWVSNLFHKRRLTSIVSRLTQLENDRGSWRHEFVCVPNLDDKADYLRQLSKDERASQARFENDLQNAKSIEKLLFGFHDFYSIDRLWKGWRCA
jgi:hypothetical protein